MSERQALKRDVIRNLLHPSSAASPDPALPSRSSSAPFSSHSPIPHIEAPPSDTVSQQIVHDVNTQGGYYGNALQAAASRGDEQVVAMLLTKGADINAQGGYYGNALQAASLRGHEKVIKTLLVKVADVNAQGGTYGNALQAASLGGNEKVVEMLLAKGADVNAQGGEYSNALQAASLRGNEKVVEMLLAKGADVNAQGGECSNALQAASLRGHKKVVEMLLAKGADVNAQGGYYGNALQAASLGGNEKVVEMLLAKGADVNAQGGTYDNALQAASWGGNEKVVEMLLAKGADVNAQGGIYGNALQAASRDGREKVGSALQAASLRGHKNVVDMLLGNGADVNVQDGIYGNALQAASLGGNEKVVEMLLAKGADVNAQGGYYGNALQAALRGGHKKVIEMLLAKGADVNAQGGTYGNALQAASLGGNEKVVEMLLAKGADVNAQGGIYGNALQAASRDGREKVVKILLAKSANVNAQGGEYSSALQAASLRGHKNVVDMLLANGADVNVQDGIYGNALQATISEKVPIPTSTNPDTTRAQSLAAALDSRNIAQVMAVLERQSGALGTVNAAGFSPDGQTVASASDDETVRLWNARTGEQTQKLEGHDRPVAAVAFSPNGQSVASASWGQMVRLWSAKMGEQTQKLEGHNNSITAVAFSPDGQTVASTSHDRAVRLWNAQMGEQTQELEGHNDSVTAVAFSPDGQTVASASRDRTVRLWNAQTGEQTQELGGHNDSVTAVAFSPNGKVVASASDDRTVRLWNAQTGEQTQELEGHNDSVTAVAFSPNGKVLASASDDRTVRLWNAQTGEETQKLEGHDMPVYAIAFFPDEQTVESTSRDRTVPPWYKYRIEATTDPDLELDTALTKNDLSIIRDLLHERFAIVAVGPWKWLHELKGLGYSVSEIAELLLEQHNDHPWIYFERWTDLEKKPKSGLHIGGCVHRGGKAIAGAQDRIVTGRDEIWQNRDDAEQHNASTRETVASLCGLAGVIPPSNRDAQWHGEVFFESDHTASVSYYTEGVCQATTWTRIKCSFKGFSSAFTEVQRRYQCCDSFTFLHRSSACRTDGISSVELSSMKLDMVLDFSKCLDAVTDVSDEAAVQSCAQSAITVLRLFSSRFAQRSDELSVEDCTDLCALVVQVLCLSFVSYCQAHTGALQLFFLQYRLREVRLLGSRSAGEAGPRIVAQLRDLTCIGAMLRDSVLVFDCAESRTLGLDDEPSAKFNLIASPQDVIDTWGPGNFVMALDAAGEEKIVSILLGGGRIYLPSKRHNTYHWSSDFRATAVSEPTIQRTEKIVIAVSISVNPDCNLDEEDCLKICDEYRDPLGTVEPYWTLVEQQAGIQAGQYATLLFNQTWAKRTGTTLKELQMLQPVDQVMPFLESTWGLQVSFCSGLARRVKMRELLADVLPAFMVRRIPSPQLWKDLRDTHNILDVLRNGDLAVWFAQMSEKHRPCFDFVCAAIRSISMILHDTGIDPTRRHFVVAWIPSQVCVPFQCIKVPVERVSYWTKVLQDSADCATFAYLTTKCLEILGRGCRNSRSSWHGEVVLVETEVHRHIDRFRSHTGLEWPWRLENGQIYPIGRSQGGEYAQLRARVQLPQSFQIPRLIVSASGIPMHYMHRLLLKRSRFERLRERLRERLTPLDKVERAFIASRPDAVST